MEDVVVGIQKVVNQPAKPIHVILADDHTLVRAGIRALLEKLPDDTQSDIINLITLSPNELNGATGNSVSNLEFDDPSPSTL